MNKFILDTDICIYWLKGNQDIERNIIFHGLNNIFITVITECELFYGACKSSQREKNLAVMNDLRKKILTLHTAESVPYRYGRIKSELESTGTKLDDADILIACITLHHQATLVTNNTRHFGRIEGLSMENWSVKNQ